MSKINQYIVPAVAILFEMSHDPSAECFIGDSPQHRPMYRMTIFVVWIIVSFGLHGFHLIRTTGTKARVEFENCRFQRSQQHVYGRDFTLGAPN